MAAKPNIPVSRKEMYLDVATGGSTELPSPVTREEKYLAKIAGESVGIPTPVTRYEMLLAAVAGESYTLTPVTRLEVYLAKAAGQDVEVPQPITREEMYWFDYVNGQPTPSEQEYTGAVPVTFIADGTPLLDYLISGNEEHSGTPAPDNLITPEGTGERTENLFDKNNANIYNAYINTSHEWILSESAKTVKIQCEPNTVYTLSVSSTLSIFRIYESSNENIAPTERGVLLTPILWGENKIQYTFTTSSTAKVLIFQGSSSDYNMWFNSLMLNLGSTALPYEPYGYKIQISSANTTTPVYLGEVETTRKVKKLVLTGEENFGKDLNLDNLDDYFYTDRISGMLGLITPISSHFISGERGAIDSVWVTGTAAIPRIVLEISKSYTGITSTDDKQVRIAKFKSYLATQYANGTPVTIWYVLAEPETEVVNEPLMKIGDYADTLSMEQAGAEIPTVNGENTLDVLTTVKPSEVYIKYKGEPVAGSQTSSQSSAYAPAEVSGQSESIDDINNGLIGKEEETE